MEGSGSFATQSGVLSLNSLKRNQVNGGNFIVDRRILLHV